MKKNYARNDLDHLSTPEYTRSKDEKYVSCIIHFISSIYVIKITLPVMNVREIIRVIWYWTYNTSCRKSNKIRRTK